ncbi:hypothetical protein SDC9_90602 [bioreactor metagenome]|uniref:Uncharacterized protein n=1 Tax=bioreactor metagenome TaxID=1076179 RepID=A0A645A2A0_9ZZZZ
MPDIHLIVGAGEQNTVFKRHLRPVDQRLIPAANGIVVHNGNMHDVQLVFDAARIMRVPVILQFAVRVGIVQLVRKKRRYVRRPVRLAIPEVDDSMRLSHRIMLHMIAADILRGGFPVRGNKPAGARLVKLQPVKRALNAVSLHHARAERRAAMGTLIRHTAEHAVFVPKEREFKIHPLRGDDAIFPNRFGWQYGIPLVLNHCGILLLSAVKMKI